MTAPPAGALEACLLLVGVSQEIRLLEKFGNNTVPIGQAAKWATEIDAALLAALRLREAVRQARTELRLMACDLQLLRPNEPLSVVGRKHYAERINATADDLARVLEESATGDEAGSA